MVVGWIRSSICACAVDMIPLLSRFPACLIYITEEGVVVSRARSSPTDMERSRAAAMPWVNVVDVPAAGQLNSAVGAPAIGARRDTLAKGSLAAFLRRAHWRYSVHITKPPSINPAMKAITVIYSSSSVSASTCSRV